ncbi:hypothetical protein AVEN_88037-1 [Araneus ventricosus]|uniref:Uncharacterized protein n=1 Tax=Araneus ventricosus TaxID=182803 RepID=A0A4Y2L671_ARAVE|nr:hypothetical protein AVEN_88037-1 [Araneus ventricosus]
MRGRGDLVVRFRLRDRRVPGSKPIFGGLVVRVRLRDRRVPDPKPTYAMYEVQVKSYVGVKRSLTGVVRKFGEGIIV